MFLRCCVGNTLNTHSRSGEYPSETRWTFKQIKLVQKIEIQIDGFNLYLTGWQVPLPHSPAKWNIAVAPRQGRGEVCTGHSRSSRLLCLLFWMMGKINETRALIPSTQSFIIPANIVNKNFSFFKVLLSCQIMSLMNNDLRMLLFGVVVDVSRMTDHHLVIGAGWGQERTSWWEEQPQQFGKMSKLLCHAAGKSCDQS